MKKANRKFYSYLNLDKNNSIVESEASELSKYVPLRFLICMISAISNPFLYSYFNETFKNGLERVFSLCCLSINRETDQILFSQTDYPLNTHKKSKTNYFKSKLSLSDRQSSLRASETKSTRLTVMGSNQFSSIVSV